MVFNHAENHLAFAFDFAFSFALGFAFGTFFIEIFFHEITHDGYPLLGFFIVLDFFFEQWVIHVFGLIAQEIVHELSER